MSYGNDDYRYAVNRDAEAEVDRAYREGGYDDDDEEAAVEEFRGLLWYLAMKYGNAEDE